MEINMKKVLGIILALVLVCSMFAVASAEGKKLKVAYITNSMSNEMNAYGFKIMEQHADQYNMEVTAFDGQYNAQVETAAITNCIGQGFDAIILCPSDINAAGERCGCHRCDVFCGSHAGIP